MANKSILNKKRGKTLLVLLLVTLPLCVFWAPAYEGLVIDATTKQPLEGALVVVSYRQETYWIADVKDSTIKVKTVKTDNNGRFSLPSYLDLKWPISWKDASSFLIYTEGYGELRNLPVEDCFTSGCNEMDLGFLASQDKKVRIKGKTVELPLLSNEEKKRQRVNFPFGVTIN